MRGRVSLIAALLILLIAGLAGHHGGQVRQTVVDVSWPNCGTKQVAYTDGIIGVTGGLDFHKNPCLTQESTWFVRYALYINTGYPGDARALKYQHSPRSCKAADSRCLAYNYGYHEALYAINYADLEGVHSNLWWLDVETENSWVNDQSVNRQFIAGATAGLQQNIWPRVTVGVYSSPLQWQQITGSWHNGLPVWLATGGTDPLIAAKDCRDRAFTGGSLWLTQYTVKLDQNVVCSDQFPLSD